MTDPDNKHHASCSDVHVEDKFNGLRDDPHERNNLVDDPEWASVRAGLREKLLDFMKQAGEKRPEIRTRAQ